MEITDQYKIEHYIYHTCQPNKIKWCFRITQSTQNTTYNIISYYKQNTQRAYQNIIFRIYHRFDRSMHQFCYPTMKKHHDQS